MAFLVAGKWTGPAPLFTSVKAGEIVSYNAMLSQWPTNIRIKAGGTDGWAYTRITIVSAGVNYVSFASQGGPDWLDVGDLGLSSSSKVYTVPPRPAGAFTLKIQTATVTSSGSGTGASVAFLVASKWTEAAPLFTSVQDGELVSYNAMLSQWPTSLRITAGGGDGWGYSRITIVSAGMEYLVFAAEDGAVWVDGNDPNQSPVTNEYALPGKASTITMDAAQQKHPEEEPVMLWFIAGAAGGVGAVMLMYFVCRQSATAQIRQPLLADE